LIIRDPVHGDVEFTEGERAVLDAREVQRLRGIKQLGTSYLVYPGALHTRFDHSIGTMAVAKRIIRSLRSSGHEIDGDDELLVTVTSLLHDIAHVPFGHTFEDERKILPSHDRGDRIRAFLDDGELADVLDDLGIKQPVLELLLSGEPLEKNLDVPWLAQIVKDAISSDLLDYLRRDSYFTGLEQNYDDRVFRYFILTEYDVGRSSKVVLAVNLGKEGMVRQDARSEVLHLLRMRYFLTERVYYHHAKQASGAMISKALELCIRDGLEHSDLKWMNDWTLFEALKSRAPGKRLISGIEGRRLYKRALVLGPEIGTSKRNELISLYNRPGPDREDIEETILDELRRKGADVGEGDVIVHCPDLGTMKEARVFARDEEEMVDKLHRHRRPISRDLDHIENQYLAIWNFFIFTRADVAVKANEIAQGLFPSEGINFRPKEYI
jgi:HD superfamily phosphohydrolase